MRTGWIVLGLVVACGGGGGREDAGGDTAGVPPAATTAAEGIEGVALAAALAGPMIPDGDLLHRGRVDATETDGRTRSEHGFSGDSVVDPPSCAAFDWAGLSATVTLTGCTFEATGLAVSGALTLAVTLDPTSFQFTFTDLAVTAASGVVTFDGTATLAVSGGDGPGATTTVDATITYASGGATTTVALSDATIAVNAAGDVTVGGTVTITPAGGSPVTAVLAGVTWVRGDCLPSSGTAVVADTPPVTITFLPTTPDDGEVQVQVAGLPPTTQALFPPCP